MTARKRRIGGVKGSVPTIFTEPNGDIVIKWNKGGVIPQRFHGIFPSRRAAELAIDQYNRDK